jgi:crotonobetainyl-CoA:carnitine CoA-transferase CaiB-like acyl-CoA transferase
MARVVESETVSGALPLSDLRVIECGEGVAAAFATKLMAMLGAEVIKVERPVGDVTRERGPFVADRVHPEQCGLFLYLNADKRGVTMNLNDSSDRARLDHLLASADVLVHNIPLAERAVTRMETDSICARHPHLIVTNISAYGERGPRANYRAYELNVAHASGAAILAPLNSDRPELPPLKLFGHQMEFQGATHAALATLAACFDRMKSGGGQSIEVSSQECVAAMLELSFVFYTYQQKQTSRLGGRILGPWGIFDCADGKVLLACVEEAQWQRLVELMGNPAWAQEEIFKNRLSRGRNSDALSLLIADWTKALTVNELFHGAQKVRIPVAPVNRMADVFADSHIRSRGILRRLPLHDSTREIEVPAVPFNSSVMGSKLERPAPRLGEHNAEFEELCRRKLDAAASSILTRRNEAGPLSGVRVLDFSWVWQGPFCTLQLAHLGAEVIRIESAKRIDINRVIPPFADGESGYNRAGSFNQWNQGKRSLLLNLESREGIEIARSLVSHCDLVVENFAPGVIGRMGLGYDALRELRPDLIMLSLSGYGQTGPYSRYVSYGGLLGAQSGLFSVSGYSNAQPLETGITYGDPNAGALGAYAAVAALIHRARTGQGQYIDVALWEALEFVMPEAWLEYQMNRREPIVAGNRDRWMAPHNCYKSLGDAEHWISIAVRDDEEWCSLCRAIDQPALAADPRFRTRASRKQNEDELDAIITRWTSQRDRWEATEILQRAGVAAMPTLSNKDLAHDLHLKQRGFLVELEHPEVGRRIHAGVPWTMSETPCQVRRPAPLLGADTDDVLTTLLGYSADRIADLRRTGVLA